MLTPDTALLPRCNRTKIVVTLGPASSTPAQIRALFEAGADVFRLNFSHGSQEEHRARLRIIRALEAEIGRPTAVMMDLQGPKLRLGIFAAGSIQVAAGDRFRFDLDPTPGDSQRAPLPHPEIFAALKPGAALLVDDGRVRLRVVACGADYADVEVVTGGVFSDRKGVNVPGVILPLSPLTEKDRADMAFGLAEGVDWCALSFVQKAEDVEEARRLVAGRALVLAKLEKPAAIDAMESIIACADGVMVARGDLGVEMPPEDVPVLQRRIVAACRRMGRPVVVATQMLDSMVERPVPTRAEASDVATAVYEGADAVMLSAETASGLYPREAVAMMRRIIARVQKDPGYWERLAAERPTAEPTTADAVSAAVRQLGETIGARAIVTYTTSGSTTLRAARERPAMPVICLTPRLETARRMALAWGVHPAQAPNASSMGDMVAMAARQCRAEGIAAPGELIAIAAGLPFGTPGKTNLIRVVRIRPDGVSYDDFGF